VSADPVGRLIELGRDGEAAHLAVRNAGGPTGLEKTTMEGPLEQFEAVAPVFVDLIHDDRDGFLELETPCEGWLVRDLLAHINGGARQFAAAFAEREVHERDLDDDPVGAIEEALAEFDAAVRSPGALERPVNSPFGPMGGETFARLAALDLLMHTWDLSRATGRTAQLPEEIVRSADEFARQAITADLRTPGVFGPEVDAPANSNRLDALAAFTGRHT
jgi:uncharacterized protein (TIGR03086 family)